MLSIQTMTEATVRECVWNHVFQYLQYNCFTNENARDIEKCEVIWRTNAELNKIKTQIKEVSNSLLTTAIKMS
jgi:hypothetical protein